MKFPGGFGGLGTQTLDHGRCFQNRTSSRHLLYTRYTIITKFIVFIMISKACYKYLLKCAYFDWLYNLTQLLIFAYLQSRSCFQWDGDMGQVKEFGLLLRPWGSDRWDRHLFLKHDDNRQRILFKFALLATWLRNHLRSVEWEVKPLQLMKVMMSSHCKSLLILSILSVNKIQAFPVMQLRNLLIPN